MDDFFEFFILPAIGAVIVVGLILAAGNSIDRKNNQKHRDSDKRYELCLKNHKDWIDGNCVTAVK